MSKRNARRKNKKIKFSEKDYIEKNYIVEEGKAIIPIEIKSADDLYMKHDYKRLELSHDICDYIEEIAYMIPINTDLVLEIHCPKLTEEQQEKVRKTIKINYGVEIDDIDYDINMLDKRTLVLLLFGFALLVINMLLVNHLTPLVSQLLDVIWWVGIWNSAEIQLFDKNDCKWERLNYQQIYESEIVFIFDR